MSAELILLVPVFVFFLMLIAGVGRYSQGHQLVEDTSAAAARAASLATSPAQASTDARQIATTTLRDAGLSCRSTRIDVDVTAFDPGGQVSVTVHCTVDLSSLVMSGLPKTVTLSATSTSVLELYRSFTGTSS
jgi:Flp pilus assembly protein TadG